MQRRLIKMTAALMAIGLAFFLGLTVQRAWFPPADMGAALTSPAEASPGETTAALPSSRGEMPVTEVVKKVSPSVVTVGAFKRAYVPQEYVDQFMRRFYRRVLSTEKLPYMGSGFIVTDSGQVVTNYHVIEDSTGYFVTLTDGREFQATLVDADRYSDVALLQILNPDGEKLPPPLQFADLSNAQIGQKVVTFGNPFGNLIQDSTPTVTVGYVSALNRTFRPDDRTNRVYQDMVQTDAAINPGNSGGPLVDLHGNVVGVNTFIFSPSGGNTGISFAIPATRVKMFVDEIVTYGRLRPLLFDFSGRDVRIGSQLAVQVLWLQDSGPASMAGLALGDLITEVDGRPVETFEQLRLLFVSKQVGEQVHLTVLRDGVATPLELDYRVQEAQRT